MPVVLSGSGGVIHLGQDLRAKVEPTSPASPTYATRTAIVWWGATAYHAPRKVLTSAGAVPVVAPSVNDKRVDPETGERQRFSSSIAL
jgi:hypothetical protein